MALNITQSFNTLLNNFLQKNKEVEALIVSDKEGLVVAGETSKDVDLEVISVLTAVVTPILERIRNEFAFKRFGTASFDTDEHRLVFISVDENITLSVVLNTLASIDKISPYAYFLAEKTAQIIHAEEGESIQLDIPNFEYEGATTERLKNQIYQMRLDTGGVYRFKFIIIGDHDVGKTSIVRRYVDNKFSKDYRATIGLNILSHFFKFLGNDITLSLWDIGAQQYFKRFRKTYYMGSQAAFIVFDVTDRKTYENVEIWFNEIVEFIEIKDLPVVIVGNKIDLEVQRAVNYQEGVQLAIKLAEKGISKISYIETSALTGENVSDAFSLISMKYIQKSIEYEEKIIKSNIYEKIKNILSKKKKLSITLITYTEFWSPALQILLEITDLGNNEKITDSKSEKVIKYENGLLIRNYSYENAKGKDCDGIICIFDGRDKKAIDNSWRDLIIKIIGDTKKNTIFLIGIRVSEESEYSLLIEQFNINEYIEKRPVSVLFFKMGDQYRLEISDQLIIMLSSIENM